MKRLLNTLFVTTQGAYLAREGDNLLVRVEQETRLRVPIHTLGSVVCFGVVNASPQLMQLCGEHGVVLAFFAENGRFMARVEGPVSGNVLLRVEQYRRAADPAASASIARSIVAAKTINSRAVLLRAARETPLDSPVRLPLTNAARQLGQIARKHAPQLPLDDIRGLEGDAARTYFGVFDYLIVSQKDAFSFTVRSRRPPLDPVNALLSFLYTMLAHDVRAALEGVGIDPQVGFLHRLRPGRPSLALDLMEELRAPLADRLVLTLINRQQVKPSDFSIGESGEVRMHDTIRKEVLLAWQRRKQDEIRHPFLEETIPIGLVPHAQALLLSRHLRGDLDAYPPMIWK
ncbi:type I-C CRISPR-associated endonuclease Cas1c [bacterium]|nr:type I-C CRISPR-associated endonuclease Cas1c [bacterium]